MARLHRVLIIGAGSIGERHLRCFQATRRAEVAFVEINPQLRREVMDRHRVVPYADLDAALTNEHDAAVIATPAPLHVPLATRLAALRIHVLIEKPLSVNLDGVDRLRQAIQDHHLVAAVAYVYRCHPGLAAMREAIHNSRFGRPVQLVAVSGQHFPTYRPAYRDIYYKDRATGGGAIQDALTHVINAGEWLIGPVQRLVADAHHQVLEGVDVEDTVHVLTRQAEALSSYSLNQHQAPNETTLTVICENGTARCDFHENRWRWMTRPEEPWHDEPAEPLERDTLFIAQANAFLDAVEGRRLPPCSLDEGLQTLRVNLAALASVETGTWQTV